MAFLQGMALLLGFQLMGEVIVMVLGIRIPGPVLGMILLFCVLLFLKRLPGFLGETTGSLLPHLSLLFVPAGVGVMAHWSRIGDDWAPIAAALVGGTLIAMLVTALVMNRVFRWLSVRSVRG